MNCPVTCLNFALSDDCQFFGTGALLTLWCMLPINHLSYCVISEQLNLIPYHIQLTSFLWLRTPDHNTHMHTSGITNTFNDGTHKTSKTINCTAHNILVWAIPLNRQYYTYIWQSIWLSEGGEVFFSSKAWRAAACLALAAWLCSCRTSSGRQ